MKEESSEEYSNAMIEAYIDKPEKTLWYQMAFSRFNINGVDKLTWHWSWWAFFCGFLFLLYRKAYLPALIVFVLSITLGMIPFIGLILMVLLGGYSTYFIYKNYKKSLLETEAVVADEAIRIETMKGLGGYNQWVVWFYGIFMTFLFLGIFTSMIIPVLAHL